MQLRFHDVTFSHEGATCALFEGINLHFSPGWTAIIGANGAGKTSLLDLARGALEPLCGSVEALGTAVHCPQRTDTPPTLLPRFLTASDRDAHRLQGILKIDSDWARRWDTLSHGERKRIQIATALWRTPDILTIDEPTNHVDAEV